MGSCVVIYNHSNKQYLHLSWKWGELFENKELMVELLELFRNEWYNSTLEFTTDTNSRFQDIKKEYTKIQLDYQ